MLDSTQYELQQALRGLEFLNSLLEDHCGKDAPGLGSIRSAIEDILAFVGVELTDRRKPVWLPSILRNKASGATAPIPNISNVSGPEAIATEHALRTREQAYQELSKIAEFLLRTEPHSPTPYLIQRAASWGEMPLPALVQQLSDSGGDIVRLLDVLGLSNTCVEFDQNDRHQ
jgi:hypothetical protein